MASARLPNTMKQARAPATLGKVTSNPHYRRREPNTRHSCLLGSFRDCRTADASEGAGNSSTAMLATPGELCFSPSRWKLSSDPTKTKPATTRADCTRRLSAARPHLMPDLDAPCPPPIVRGPISAALPPNAGYATVW
jgi:hypothetical protein